KSGGLVWPMRRFCNLRALVGDRSLLRAGLYLVIAPLLTLSSCNPPEASAPAASPTPGSSVAPSSSQPEAVQQNLAAAFAASHVLFEAKTPGDLLKFTPLQQVQLAQDPAGLTITAAGNDPSVFVPAFPAKSCLVKIEITAPAN